MKKLLLSYALFLVAAALQAQSPPKATLQPSRCHVFIDQENIWTLEMVENENGTIIPILNIITFSPGRWEFRPEQIHIFDATSKEAEVEGFSMETGLPDEPFVTKYFTVLGNSFIGLDLLGSFHNFSEPTTVFLELGENQFQLKSIDCMDFEMLAEKINRINVDSPDIQEDFNVLQIEPLGEMGPKTQ
jgi:hypothetical protein